MQLLLSVPDSDKRASNICDPALVKMEKALNNWLKDLNLCPVPVEQNFHP